MTGERVKAAQQTRPPKGARLHRGTVSQVTPLTVSIEGGASVSALAVPGATYVVGDAVSVLAQEPGIGAAFPITSIPAPIPSLAPYSTTAAVSQALLGYMPVAAFSSIPIITALDTAPDGPAFCSASNPLGGTILVETYSVPSVGWRFQRISHESNGTTRTRRKYAGGWSGWANASTS